MNDEEFDTAHEEAMKLIKEEVREYLDNNDVLWDVRDAIKGAVRDYFRDEVDSNWDELIKTLAKELAQKIDFSRIRIVASVEKERSE